MKLFPKSFERRRLFKKRRHPKTFITRTLWAGSWGIWPAACVFALVAITIPFVAQAGGKDPADVTAFVHDADICVYLSGEWDSNLPQRRKDTLSREMDATCTHIRARQEALQKKYRADRAIMSELGVYQF